MNQHVKRLTDEASQLPAADRVELVEGILHSLDATDPRLDQIWADEAKDRLAAYRRGEIASVGLDDVLARHRPPTDRT